MLRIEDRAWSDAVYWQVFHEWTRRHQYFWGESNDPRFSLIRILSTISWARRVLSVGCGTGIVEHFLPHSIDVVGIDVDLEKLRIGWGLSPWTMFLLGDAEHLPFGDEAFDLVLAVSVIEFVDDKDKFLDEVVRVLSPQGHCLLCTPNGEHPNYAAMRPQKMVHGEVAPLLEERFGRYVKWQIVTWDNDTDERFLFYEAKK